MDDVTMIGLENLGAVAREMAGDGWRLLTLTAVDLGQEGFDILYHFDKDLASRDYRLTIDRGTTVPSISGTYLAAFLVENEIRDQFGVCFSDIALDFGGHLYLEDEVRATPFCKYSITEKPKSEGDA